MNFVRKFPKKVKNSPKNKCYIGENTMFKVLVHTITLISISVTIWIIEIKSVARQQEKKNQMKIDMYCYLSDH